MSQPNSALYHKVRDSDENILDRNTELCYFVFLLGIESGRLTLYPKIKVANHQKGFASYNRLVASSANLPLQRQLVEGLNSYLR